MFLKSLSLRNVRAIKSLDMSFVTPDGQPRKWTFVLGENGCGKSTVLRSIALLTAGSDAIAELLGDTEAWIRKGSESCTLECVISTAAGEERKLGLTLHRTGGIKQVFSGQNRDTLEQIDRAIAHSARNYFVTGYGVSRRLDKRASKDSRPSEIFRSPRAQSVATLFSSEATLYPLESWAIGMHYRRGHVGLRQVKEAFARLLPDVSLDRIDKRQSKLLFKTQDGIIPLGELSDGYQNVVAWCGDLLYRTSTVFADLKDPFSARGLLVIDEVDLHLHPVWQRNLVEFLSTQLSQFQIVVTTHSPLTVHQAGQGELFILRRERRKGPTLVQYEGEPRKLMLHQLLVSPIFGLTSPDSKQVEELRSTYRRVKKRALKKAKGRRVPRKKTARLRALEKQLKELPNWSAAAPLENEQTALLRDIRKALIKN